MHIEPIDVEAQGTISFTTTDDQNHTLPFYDLFTVLTHSLLTDLQSGNHNELIDERVVSSLFLEHYGHPLRKKITNYDCCVTLVRANSKVYYSNDSSKNQ